MLLEEDLAVPIFSNNQAYIALAKDPVAHSYTKYINVRYYYIRELVTGDKTIIDYCFIVNIIINIFIKSLVL
jgi:hypothetical protein